MNQYTAVVWGAEWCSPCLALHKAKTVEKAVTLFEKQHPETSVHIAEIDVDAFEEMADEHEVQSMPTVDFFKGARVDIVPGARLCRTVGGMNEKALVKKWSAAVLRA